MDDTEQACVNHLRLVVDEKYYKDVMEKNTEATIKSIQYLLKNLCYDCGKVDGILVTKWKKTSNTMEAIKKFQKDNWLKVDGLPGRKTINKLLEVYGPREIFRQNAKKNKDRIEEEIELDWLTRITDKQEKELQILNTTETIVKQWKLRPKQRKNVHIK